MSYATIALPGPKIDYKLQSAWNSENYWHMKGNEYTRNGDYYTLVLTNDEFNRLEEMGLRPKLWKKGPDDPGQPHIMIRPSYGFRLVKINDRLSKAIDKRLDDVGVGFILRPRVYWRDPFVPKDYLCLCFDIGENKIIDNLNLTDLDFINDKIEL